MDEDLVSRATFLTAMGVTEEGLTVIVEPVIVATSNGELRVAVFAIAVET